MLASRPRLGALLLGAAMGMMAFAPSMPAIASQPSKLSERRLDILRGGGRQSLQRARYRSKPWTCTAIEKRKAAKRRNVARHKQQVRS